MEVCITDPHFTTVTVVKEGYNPNTQNITQYPGTNQTIDIYANLTPVAVQPVANFNAVPTTGFAPLSVQFTDTSTGPPATWSWTFGDGNTSTSQNPVHTYVTPGNYSVSLTVTNSVGNSTKFVEQFH